MIQAKVQVSKVVLQHLKNPISKNWKYKASFKTNCDILMFITLINNNI
jgi:hypothetical protein